MRCALPSSSQLHATAKPASVCDTLTISAWRVAAGSSGHASSASRIAARWPKRATMRSSENCAMSAPGFSISVRQASRRADFGERGRDRARQVGAARDRGLHLGVADRDRVDQIGIEQGRRAFEHDRRDVRLSLTSACITAAGASRARAERLGERAPHQRRGIVEQHDHRAFGGDAVVVDQFGVEIGAGQRRGGFRALRGFRGAHPLQEMPYDHDATTDKHRPYGPTARSLGRAA